KLSVFNLLRGHPEDGAVIDLFAGTGAMGLEAASLGAPRVVLVEKDRRVASVIEKNIASVGAEDICEVITGDALGPAALTRCPRPVHLVFMDPPYALVRDPSGWARVRTQAARLVSMLDGTGYLVLRTPAPFFHVLDPDSGRLGAEQVPAAYPGEPVQSRHITLDLEDHDADAAPDAFEAELAHTPASHRVDPDLSIDGAIGPETHDYGTTAVHLYMKAPGDGVAY
ncbi:MAG: RsmD family RNA methyltransferase, partial [Planctomycetota bacterium]